MAELRKISISVIRPSAMNPRKTFDQGLIEELAQNIAEQGLLQPITVRGMEFCDSVDFETGEIISIPKFYEVVCGERRFRAWSHLAKKKPYQYADIPCIVRDMTDKEAFDAMITENLQRKDVDPIEEATAISLLLQHGEKTSEIAARLGKSERFVTDRVKLSKLIPELSKMVQKEQIPLTGGMLLAKLNDEKQKEFLDDIGDDSEVTVSEVKRYIDRSFGELSMTQFYSNDGFEGCGPLCAQCANNTSNYKCLFYEMNGNAPSCTNRKCMFEKEMKFLLYKIKSESEKLVKEGEPLAPGKTAVIMESSEPWWSKTCLNNYDRIANHLHELGIANLNANKYFSGRCYYSMDDDRISGILSSQKGYRCLHITREYGDTFRMEECVYWIRAYKDGGVQGLEGLESNSIVNKMERNKAIRHEKMTEELRSWAADKKDYYGRGCELTSAEQLVLAVIVLKSCGFSMRREMGLDSLSTPGMDEFSYVNHHREDKNKWIRAFIANKLSESGVLYDKTLQRCQDMLYADQFPEEYRKLTEKLDSELEKKQKRLQEKLDKLKKE